MDHKYHNKPIALYIKTSPSREFIDKYLENNSPEIAILRGMEEHIQQLMYDLARHIKVHNKFIIQSKM